MQYLNKSFWRMIAGFLAVLVIAIASLYLSQFYNGQGGGNVSPINYMAGSETKN